ncbi:hypothetical protein PSPO01_13263 [Paraphaeosphaeria sporulosa]
MGATVVFSSGVRETDRLGCGQQLHVTAGSRTRFAAMGWREQQTLSLALIRARSERITWRLSAAAATVAGQQRQRALEAAQQLKLWRLSRQARRLHEDRSEHALAREPVEWLLCRIRKSLV